MVSEGRISEEVKRGVATKEDLKDLEIRINERIYKLEKRLIVGFFVLGFLILLIIRALN